MPLKISNATISDRAEWCAGHLTAIIFGFQNAILVMEFDANEAKIGRTSNERLIVNDNI